MTYPVTGPFYKSWDQRSFSSGGEYPTFVGTRKWYRQAKPYNMALDFEYWHNRWLSGSASQGRSPGTANADWTLYNDSYYDAQAYNKAYEKFVNKARSSADWAVTLIERRKSIDMITTRATQLLKFTNSLRRFRFGEAYNMLATVNKGRHVMNWRNLKRDGRSLGSNWLEYSYGWKPLIGDIYTSVDLLQQEIKPIPLKESSKVKPGKVVTGSYDDGYVLRRFHKSYETARKIGAEILVSNPNLYLANQLGLINPAHVAWELTPWSFVLDWFANVGTVLDSLTDFHGLSLIDPYVSSKSKKTFYSNYSSHYNNGQEEWFSFFTAERVEARRVTGGIPAPELIIRQPWRLQPQRAANAISLLLQKLPKR